MGSGVKESNKIVYVPFSASSSAIFLIKAKVAFIKLEPRLKRATPKSCSSRTDGGNPAPIPGFERILIGALISLTSVAIVSFSHTG